MSLIKAIKAQLGLSVTPANNFTLDASADNGTMKLARNSGQDIMTVDAAGKPDFAQLARVMGTPGYYTLPGGLIVQWGVGTVTTSAANSVIGSSQSFPIPFTTSLYHLSATSVMASITGQVLAVHVANPTLTDTSFYCVSSITGSTWTYNWIAIGK